MAATTAPQVLVQEVGVLGPVCGIYVGFVFSWYVQDPRGGPKRNSQRLYRMLEDDGESSNTRLIIHIQKSESLKIEVIVRARDLIERHPDLHRYSTSAASNATAMSI